jgi:hypothetical protein
MSNGTGKESRIPAGASYVTPLTFVGARAG